MNQIKTISAAHSAKTTNDALDLDGAKTKLSTHQQSDIQELSEWEMLKVGGGDAIVCW